MPFRNPFFGPNPKREVAQIRALLEPLRPLSDAALRDAFQSARDLPHAIAAVAEAAARTLHLDFFDVQFRGALALARGHIAEMQTGEGKTLACTPAVAWLARPHEGVHVMTVNDYLARRDAAWMGPIYSLLGLTVGCIQQTMTPAQRNAAYACDITYGTANEIGFDFLRDQLVLHVEDRVHRPFHAAVIDEADSILIDEARIPLVLAGGHFDGEDLAVPAAALVRSFRRGIHFTLDEFGRNIALTHAGARAAESFFACGNIYDEENLALYTAVNDAIHARFLLARDVDYVVKAGAIESVDQFKGRIAPDRRWPAGLHTALEAKEHLDMRPQGRVLSSITLQNLVAIYPFVCGMTGTAATQAGEFSKFYKLDIEVIPTNRPVIRADDSDIVYASKSAKEDAVVKEIVRVHATGQPILVGTSSVEESEDLSARLDGLPHSVLNARNEEEEAAIVAQAGQRGAVTISTNMAGRGVDIQLGPGVADLGGLYVIGMNRHEARRIDNQLRGRAGRQGDPGRSRFFLSLQDDLLAKYSAGVNQRLNYSVEDLQRLVESQNLETRLFLDKYEGIVEGQRNDIQRRRNEILDSPAPGWQSSQPAWTQLERMAAVSAIDEQWTSYLEAVADIRAGIHWQAYATRDPLHAYLTKVDALYREMDAALDAEIAARIEDANAGRFDPTQRGATWTYLTTDNPFGSATERIIKGIQRKIAERSLWA